MDASSKKVIAGIGARLRKARLENNMTQEKLAGSEFTKGYVSALERGAVRPSLKALDVFSRRLNMPLSDFISERHNPDTTPEREAFQEDLVYRFNYARMLIRTGSAGEALEYVARLEEIGAPFMQKLPAKLSYWLPYLRGLAYMQLEEYSSAQIELEGALAILAPEAKKDDAAKAAAVPVRDALGVVLRRKGSPAQALEHHLDCLKEVKSSTVQDHSVLLSVYNNLVDDYRLLGDSGKALALSREVLRASAANTDLEQQALNYWRMSSERNEAGEWSDAKTYATRALHILGAADARISASAIHLKTAALLSAAGKFEEAQTQLQNAGEMLTGTGNNEMQSRLYLEYAELARSTGNIDEAANYANRSVLLSDRLRQETPGKAGKQAQLGALKLFVEAVSTAAQLAERQSKTEEADRLFDIALNSLSQPELGELLSEISYSRAQVFEQRGDHKKAMEYYRQAAQGSSK